MSEKVKLPREVAEAIEHIRASDLTDFYIIGEAYKGSSHNPHIFKIMTYIRANTGDWDEEHEKGYTHIMKALVNGYEVEETPEEKIKWLIDNAGHIADNDSDSAYIDGIRAALDAFGIKIEGVNA